MKFGRLEGVPQPDLYGDLQNLTMGQLTTEPNPGMILQVVGGWWRIDPVG